jgi:hypothetical protein
MRNAQRPMMSAAVVSTVRWKRLGGALTVAALAGASWMVIIRVAQAIL